MSAILGIDELLTETENRFCRLSAAGAVLVGAFLLLGAFGHVEAVLPRIQSGAVLSPLQLLLPGIALGIAGLINLSLCKLLWDSNSRSLYLALVLNALLLAYLCYLVWRGVPGHPIVTFTSVVASYIVVLAAQGLGMAWPAAERH